MAEETVIDLETGKVTKVSYTPPPYDAPNSLPYRIGKSTPWRRMTDDEAVTVQTAMNQAPVRQQMIYNAASYIDTSDELFTTLEGVLSAVLSPERATELLAQETDE